MVAREGTLQRHLKVSVVSQALTMVSVRQSSPVSVDTPSAVSTIPSRSGSALPVQRGPTIRVCPLVSQWRCFSEALNLPRSFSPIGEIGSFPTGVPSDSIREDKRAHRLRLRSTRSRGVFSVARAFPRPRDELTRVAHEVVKLSHERLQLRQLARAPAAGISVETDQDPNRVTEAPSGVRRIVPSSRERRPHCRRSWNDRHVRSAHTG